MAEVALLDHMGDDLMVVNAARVSHAKRTGTLRERDIGLLRYLAKHGHWTPFAHPQLSFHIRCNLAVAAQLKRHQVGLVVNEMSRRYVTDEPEFDMPEVWRAAVDDPHGNKQGSGEPLEGIQELLKSRVSYLKNAARRTYTELIGRGVAPEQARLVLPMATVTEFYWTGSLYAFSRVCRQRLAPDAQAETREVAKLINDAAQRHFPYSWEALVSVRLLGKLGRPVAQTEMED